MSPSSLGCASGSPSTFGFAWVHSDSPRGRRIHSGSLRLTLVLVRAGGNIRVRLGSLGQAKGSLGSL